LTTSTVTESNGLPASVNARRLVWRFSHLRGRTVPRTSLGHVARTDRGDHAQHYANDDGSDFGIAIVSVSAAPGARRVTARGIKMEGEMLGLFSLAIVAAIALVGCSEAPNKGPCPSGYVESGNWRVDGGTCVRVSSHDR
jgi:hypothetical protein